MENNMKQIEKHWVTFEKKNKSTMREQKKA